LNPKYAFAYNHRGVAHRKKDGLPIPQWLQPYVLSLILVTLFFVPFIYGAFKATEWKWWVRGLRFGDAQFDSNLGRAVLIANVWEMALCLCAVGIAAFGIPLFVIPYTFWLVSNVDLQSLPSPAFMALIVLGYLAFVLAYGIVF